MIKKQYIASVAAKRTQFIQPKCCNLTVRSTSEPSCCCWDGSAEKGGEEMRVERLIGMYR